MPVLSSLEVAATVESIAAIQLRNGMIPWFPGGHADPWNHVEAAMALSLGGRRAEAEAAFGWLQQNQHLDGSWCAYYLAEGVEEPRRDPNVCAYLAVGAWFHYQVTGDANFLCELWPTIERAIEWVLRLQQPGGEITWSVWPDGTPGAYALLTGSSSIYFSLRCAVAVAEQLGHERPEWELAAGRLAHAVAWRPEAFEPKDRWAMDWYYPVLSGALSGDAARSRIDERWREFVMPGVGVRCVSDRPWVTAAETAECVMALCVAERRAEARLLLEWSRHLRHDDGSYWTGCVHPDCVRFPGGERSTYTAAAIILAANTLDGSGPTADFFLGRDLPAGLDLADVTDAPVRAPRP
jgi:RES domain-containing protein